MKIVTLRQWVEECKRKRHAQWFNRIYKLQLQYNISWFKIKITIAKSQQNK